MLQFKTTWSAALGLALSISLQGCAHPSAKPDPTVVAVKVESTPPADLLACPGVPVGFPEDQAAEMPPEVREAAIRLARAYAAARAQLVRLINWNSPGACETGKP
jgi:hypothetical protein